MSITKIKASNITDGSITASKLANTYALSTDSTSASAYANTGINNAASASAYANTGINNAASASLYANTSIANAASASLYANTGINNAASASAYANTGINNAASASLYANTKVSKSGDTITGPIIISDTGSGALQVAGTVTISQDLNVSGNIFLSGSATTISSNNLTLSDPLIYLAEGNIANTADIGIVGNVTNGHYYHTGLVRDHLDGTWKFFSNVTSEPTTTVNFGEANTVYDVIKVGGVVSPTGTVSTANLAYTGTLTGGTGVVAIGTNQIYKESSGNVGIGTSSPQAKLAVSNLGAAGFEFFTNASGGGVGTYIQSYNRSGAAFVDTAYWALSHTWRTTSSTTAMVLNASGNVGIGTSSPATSLEVRKDSAAGTGITVTNKTSNSAASAGVTFNNSSADNANIALWDSGTIGAATANGLNLINNGTGGVNILANNASGTIKFASGGTTERMRIDSSGNVGIGTSTTTYRTNIVYGSSAGGPAETGLYLKNTSTGNSTQMMFDGYRNWSLLVQGSFGAPAGGFTIQDNTAGANRLSIDSSGNVGIGTSSPAQKLVIAGGMGEWRFKPDDITVGSNSEAYGTTFSGGLPAITSSTAGGGKIFLGGSGRGDSLVSAVAFYRNNVESMRIDSSGNVGIGTSSPSQKLHVAGNIFAATGVTLGAAGGEGGEIAFQSISGTSAGMIDVDGGNAWRFYNALATPTTFFTNSAERMRIDSAGRVTMPYQPRFMAYRSGNQTGYTGGTAVIFNNATINVGNHYNTTTGLFTAPVAGNYIFEVGIYMSAAIVQIWPLTNGYRVESILLTTLADQNLSATTVRYLNANDTYCLVPFAYGTAGLTIYDNGLHTYFRGSLIG